MKSPIKVERVNVYNDAEMVSLGIRLPKLTSRDSSVWSKTLSEKERLRDVRKSFKTKFVSGYKTSNKSIPVYSKLIVYIKPSDNFTIFDKKTGKTFNQTVFSHKCKQSDIPVLLSKYKEKDPNFGDYSLVIKYSWNGKTYSPKDLPFWK